MKSKKLTSSAMAIFASLLISHSLFAGEFIVSNTDDDGPGSLRNAVAQCDPEGENTIRFAPGLSGQTIAVTSGEIHQTIRDGGTLIITAANLPNGITIDAEENSRVFRFEGSNGSIEFINLTITRGQAPHGGSTQSDGGGVKCVSPLRIVDCTFIGNRAGDGAPGQRRAGNGGGIFCVSHTQVVASEFRDNHGGVALSQGDGTSITGGDGGAIFVGAFGTTTLTDSVFENNTAGKGSDSNSLANRAGYGGSGGAVHAGQSTTQVTRCLFRNNRAGDGGENLTAGNGGIGGAAGAITAAHTEVTITESTFIGNVSGQGGASNGGSSGNSGEAGAVRIFGGATGEITRCIFDRNELATPGPAENGGTAGGFQEGSAVYFQVSGGSLVRIENSIMSRNDGIAVYGLGGDGQAIHCTFAENECERGAALTAGFSNTMEMINCLFVENRNGENPAHHGTIGTGLLNSGGESTVLDEPSIDLSVSPVAANGKSPAKNFGVPVIGSPAIDGAPANGLAPANDLRGNPRNDGALDAGAVEVLYQIDNRIGTRSNPLTHRGNNVYSAAAAAQQAKVRLRGKRKKVTWISTENDGDLNHLRLRGGNGGRKLRTKTFRITGGRLNVTGACRGAGHTERNVAEGEVAIYKMEAKPKRRKNARRFKRNVDYQLSSVADAAQLDSVRAKVKYRP